MTCLRVILSSVLLIFYAPLVCADEKKIEEKEDQLQEQVQDEDNDINDDEQDQKVVRPLFSTEDVYLNGKPQKEWPKK